MYTGQFTADSISEEAGKLLKNKVLAYSEDKHEQFLVVGNRYKHVLIVKSKKDLDSLWKSLAMKYENRIVFGQITNPSQEFLDKY